MCEKRKRGRPTSHPKKAIFRMRMDEDSMDMLKQTAQELGITMSDVVRQGIAMAHDNLKK